MLSHNASLLTGPYTGLTANAIKDYAGSRNRPNNAGLLLPILSRLGAIVPLYSREATVSLSLSPLFVEAAWLQGTKRGLRNFYEVSPPLPISLIYPNHTARPLNPSIQHTFRMPFIFLASKALDDSFSAEVRLDVSCLAATDKR
uniref:Uncharacterized protein n=1 Tax=Vespula pensylvanica TaxID=30213 RepID=A0A834PEH2_VESPE|nr:hypothetical protein H0235_000451 [Vespula pensylvanica]